MQMKRMAHEMNEILQLFSKLSDDLDVELDKLRRSRSKSDDLDTERDNQQRSRRSDDLNGEIEKLRISKSFTSTSKRLQQSTIIREMDSGLMQKVAVASGDELSRTPSSVFDSLSGDMADMADRSASVSSSSSSLSSLEVSEDVERTPGRSCSSQRSPPYLFFKDNKRRLLEEVKQSESKWHFSKATTHEMIKELLETREHGAFVVRDADESMELFVKRDDNVDKFLIRKSATGLKLDNSDEQLPSFKCLSDLILNHFKIRVGANFGLKIMDDKKSAENVAGSHFGFTAREEYGSPLLADELKLGFNPTVSSQDSDEKISSNCRQGAHRLKRRTTFPIINLNSSMMRTISTGHEPELTERCSLKGKNIFMETSKIYEDLEKGRNVETSKNVKTSKSRAHPKLFHMSSMQEKMSDYEDIWTHSTIESNYERKRSENLKTKKPNANNSSLIYYNDNNYSQGEVFNGYYPTNSKKSSVGKDSCRSPTVRKRLMSSPSKSNSGRRDIKRLEKEEEEEEDWNANYVYNRLQGHSERNIRTLEYRRPTSESPAALLSRKYSDPLCRYGSHQTNSSLMQTSSPSLQMSSPSFKANFPHVQTNSPSFRTSSSVFQKNSPSLQMNSSHFQTNSPSFQTNSPSFQRNSPTFQTNSPFQALSSSFQRSSPHFLQKNMTCKNTAGLLSTATEFDSAFHVQNTSDETRPRVLRSSSECEKHTYESINPNNSNKSRDLFRQSSCKIPMLTKFNDSETFLTTKQSNLSNPLVINNSSETRSGENHFQNVLKVDPHDYILVENVGDYVPLEKLHNYIPHEGPCNDPLERNCIHVPDEGIYNDVPDEGIYNDQDSLTVTEMIGRIAPHLSIRPTKGRSRIVKTGSFYDNVSNCSTSKQRTPVSSVCTEYLPPWDDFNLETVINHVDEFDQQQQQLPVEDSGKNNLYLDCLVEMCSSVSQATDDLNQQYQTPLPIQANTFQANQNGLEGHLDISKYTFSSFQNSPFPRQLSHPTSTLFPVSSATEAADQRQRHLSDVDHRNGFASFTMSKYLSNKPNKLVVRRTSCPQQTADKSRFQASNHCTNNVFVDTNQVFEEGPNETEAEEDQTMMKIHHHHSPLLSEESETEYFGCGEFLSQMTAPTFHHKEQQQQPKLSSINNVDLRLQRQKQMLNVLPINISSFNPPVEENGGHYEKLSNFQFPGPPFDQPEINPILSSYLTSLSEKSYTTLGALIQSFIRCTKESKNTNPHDTCRNVRQFLSGIRNYMNNGFDSDISSFLKIIFQDDTPDFAERLDVTMEAFFESAILRPLKTHVCRLFQQQHTRNGDDYFLLEGFEIVKNNPIDYLQLKSETVASLDKHKDEFNEYLKKILEQESAIAKLKTLRCLATSIVSIIPSFRNEKSNSLSIKNLMSCQVFLSCLAYSFVCLPFSSAETEVDFMKAFIRHRSLTDEDKCLLSAFQNAIDFLKKLGQNQHE